LLLLVPAAAAGSTGNQALATVTGAIV